VFRGERPDGQEHGTALWRTGAIVECAAMTVVIRRRRGLVTLGACALGPPFGAIAQSPARPLRVGFLAFPTRPPAIDAHAFGGFPRGLRELGYVEGRNLSIEWRFADGQRERLDELAQRYRLRAA
jgi:putative ABC transport system substrate-binding protein